MGRRHHSNKMHKMSAVWGKHGQHKHMAEVARLWNSLTELRKRRRGEFFGSVSELFRNVRRR